MANLIVKLTLVFMLFTILNVLIIHFDEHSYDKFMKYLFKGFREYEHYEVIEKGDADKLELFHKHFDAPLDMNPRHSFEAPSHLSNPNTLKEPE